VLKFAVCKYEGIVVNIVFIVAVLLAEFVKAVQKS
jgi:hypothetical protein